MRGSAVITSGVSKPRQLTILDVPATRSKRHACQYKWVRRIGPHSYQARVWLPVERGGSINLGLYDSEIKAYAAVRAWVKAGADPVKGLPECVLPKYVRGEEGRFHWSVTTRAGKITSQITYRTAADAHRAAVSHLNATRSAVK